MHKLTGSELLRRRVALGMTQDDLAHLFGVSPDTLSRWERGALAIRHAGAIELALCWLEFLAHTHVASDDTITDYPIDALRRTIELTEAMIVRRR